MVKMEIVYKQWMSVRRLVCNPTVLRCTKDHIIGPDAPDRIKPYAPVCNPTDLLPDAPFCQLIDLLCTTNTASDPMHRFATHVGKTHLRDLPRPSWGVIP